MSYTVKQLAKLSGVSVRTLHFYDEIGLLMPAYLGDNNYRYYEKEQLLLLQQILLYREMGFSLNKIKKILSSDSFDKLSALESQKKILGARLDQTQKLIKTIEKTISHLRGEITMSDQELYYGFDSEKQKAHEKTLVEKGIVSQEFINESNQKIAQWTDAQKNEFIREIEDIMKALIVALENNVSPASSDVQQLMKKHYEWLCKTWTPNKERYLGLTDLYQTTEFRVFYDKRHPKLLAYILEAMKVFAERNF